MLGVCLGGMESKEVVDIVMEDKLVVWFVFVIFCDVDQIEEYIVIVEVEVKNNIVLIFFGCIDCIFVEVGDYVFKGQKLVQMDVVNLK